MLFALLSLVLADTRVGNLPPYQWPADKFKSAAIGASGTITWRDDGSQKNAVLDCPGVDPTGMTYSDVGINNCIAASAPSGDSNGTAFYFPRGVYKLQNPINLTKRTLIYGDGMLSTWFYPDPGVTGVIVRYACEGGPCTTTRGDLSEIRDVGFEWALNASAWVANQGVGLGYVAHGSTGPSNLNMTQVFQVTTAGTTAATEPTWGSANEGDFIVDGTATWHAIVVSCIRFNARAIARNVYCDRASGNGITIEASVPSKNANSWFLDNVYIQQAVLNGLYVQGSDANAGMALAVHSGSNRLWGIYDNSFLGNTYEACSTEANGLGAYGMVGVAATNILNGCYSESGQPPSILTGASMAVGGLQAAGFTSNSGAFRMAPGNKFETSGGGIHFQDTTAPSGAHIDMPYAGGYLMNLTDTAEGNVGFTVQNGTSPGNAGWWKWRHANLDGRTIMSWGGTNSDAPYSVWFPPGLYLGNRIFMDSGASAPSWPASPQSPGSLRVNTSTFPQNGFQAGVFGWQQAGNGSFTSQIETLRWSNFGNANEKILTANGVGSPYAFNWLTDAGLMFTNIGASAKQYITLTTQAFNPDLRYTELYLYVEDADGMRVTAGGNAFTYGRQSTVGGGYLESTTPGSWIKLKASSQTGYWWSWNVAEISGVWTDGTQTLSSIGTNNVAKTSGLYNVTSGDTGTTFTNRGATGTVTYQLPTAAVGLRYRFVVDAAQAIIILNNTGDNITMDGVTFDTGSLPQLVNNAHVGSTLDIEAVDVDHWYVTNRAGRWETDNFTSTEFHRDLPPYETYLNPNAGYVLTVGATGELAWSPGPSGIFVKKTGDTMSGALTFSGGGPINFRGTTGQNILNLPTGEVNGLTVNDTSGQWYIHADTQNQTFNFDVTSGYNGAVYMNQGNLFFNGSHLNNIIVVPDSDTDALDIKDGGGTYLSVYNTTTKSVSLHGSNTNDAAASGYVGEHLQAFVYAASGPTGIPASTGTLTQTIVSQSVTAGDWMVRGTACLHNSTNSSGIAYQLIAAISDTNNSLGSSVVGLSQVSSSGGSLGTSAVTLGFDHCTSVGPTRISLSATTTEYLVAKWAVGGVTTQTIQLYGSMEWWRVR